MIPLQTGDIDVNWLNHVLADHPGVGVINDVRAESMGEGVGILGELGRLHLSYASGQSGPSTLVAKCQSKFPENVFISQLMGFYTREVNFYNQLSATLDLRVPHCYFADAAPDGAPFVLLLEEVTGARLIDQVAGATLDDCHKIADIAAALHSTYWESPALYALEWLPPWNNDGYKAAQGLGQAKLASFEDTWATRIPAEAMAWMHKFTDRYPEILDWWVAQGNVTLAHTDFRAENFLFGGSAGSGVVTLVDFQLMTRHVGVWDIANFLGASVTVDNRRAWEQNVLDRYHGALVAAGVTGYSREQCQLDYRYCTLQQAWSQIPISGIDPANDRGRALLDAMITRSFQSATDNAAGEMLELF
jgi:Phosphotransferase enzyme family